jgi:hypothetical protein
MLPLFDAMARDFGINGAFIGYLGCTPVQRLYRERPDYGCRRFRETARQFIAEADIETLFLVARWRVNIQGHHDGSPVKFLGDDQTEAFTPAESLAAFARQLPRMVDEIAAGGPTVYILKQVPEQYRLDLRHNIRQIAFEGLTDIAIQGVGYPEHRSYQADVDAVIDGVAGNDRVFAVDAAPVLCRDGRSCDIKVGREVYYYDTNHLSPVGAQLLEPLFRPAFEAMAAR